MSTATSLRNTPPSPRPTEPHTPRRNHDKMATTPTSSSSTARTSTSQGTEANGTPAPSPATLPHKLTVKLEEARMNALSMGHDVALYLGLPSTPDHVAWFRKGSAKILVTTAALQSYEKARVVYNAADDNSPPPDPEPANLAIIAKISPRGTFLAPDGNYGNNSSKFKKDFHKTQLNIQLESIADHPTFAADFDRALENLRDIERRGETSPKTSKASVVISPSAAADDPDPHKIKLRHNVFRKPRSEDENNEDDDDTYQDLPSECRIQNWPTTTAAAQEALNNIIKSHIAQPLPAYDPSNDNKIIVPSQYTKLRGALCFIRFTLTHYAFSEEKGASGSKIRDVYVADVTSITALHIPVESAASKKRIAATDPCSPSPTSKKQRLN